MLAVSDTSTAVYLPVPRAAGGSSYDNTGSEESSADLSAPPTPASLQHSSVSQAAGLITWWTGDSLVVFDANRLAYRYTIPTAGPAAPLGPATMMANKLLIPVTGGVGVYEASAGNLERVIPVDRPAGAGPVVPGGRPPCSSSAAPTRRAGLTGSRPEPFSVHETPGRSGEKMVLGDQTSGVKVASFLPDFQCLSKAVASSR